jgi:hypothetical protein
MLVAATMGGETLRTSPLQITRENQKMTPEHLEVLKASFGALVFGSFIVIFFVWLMWDDLWR